jgi:hypothetical protein
MDDVALTARILNRELGIAERLKSAEALADASPGAAINSLLAAASAEERRDSATALGTCLAQVSFANPSIEVPLFDLVEEAYIGFDTEMGRLERLSGQRWISGLRGLRARMSKE